MNLPSVHVDSAFNLLSTTSTHQVLYMVRRRRYEIVLAVRRQQAVVQDENQAIVQECLKRGGWDAQLGSVLDVGATKALYEDLSQFIKYLHA